MVVFAIRIDETHLKSCLPSKGKKGVEKVAILAAETLAIMSLLIMPSAPQGIADANCLSPNVSKLPIAIAIANVPTSSPSSRVTVSMSG